MRGGIAQLGERLLCKQQVTGSIPVASTTSPRALESAGRPVESKTDALNEADLEARLTR